MADQINPDRLRAQFDADSEVIRVLRESGDVPLIVRPVDVLFLGDVLAIAKVKAAVKNAEWRVVREFVSPNGQHGLEIQREQTTEPDEIQKLTEQALKIELATGAQYDGWGTVPQQRPQKTN